MSAEEPGQAQKSNRMSAAEALTALVNDIREIRSAVDRQEKRMEQFENAGKAMVDMVNDHTKMLNKLQNNPGSVEGGSEKKGEYGDFMEFLKFLSGGKSDKEGWEKMLETNKKIVDYAASITPPPPPEYRLAMLSNARLSVAFGRRMSDMLIGEIAKKDKSLGAMEARFKQEEESLLNEMVGEDMGEKEERTDNKAGEI